MKAYIKIKNRKISKGIYIEEIHNYIYRIYIKEIYFGINKMTSSKKYRIDEEFSNLVIRAFEF